MLNKSDISPKPSRAARGAFYVLYIGFILLPILAGGDKILHFTDTWPQYLSPFITGLLNMKTETVLTIVGFIEFAAGIIVAFKPKIGSAIVAVWLLGIIANLASIDISAMYDIILRDIGLTLAAIALFMLSPS